MFAALRVIVVTSMVNACVTVASKAEGVAPGRFHYDASTGLCTDPATGEQGYNAPDLTALLSTYDKDSNAYGPADAECVDFNGIDFSQTIGLSYPSLKDWNFRGAKLTGAKLHFAYIDDADFSGATLVDFKIGYVTISGKADRFTKAGRCAVSPDNLVSCRI